MVGSYKTDRTVDVMSLMVLMVPAAVVFLMSWVFVNRLLGQESDIFHGDHDQNDIFFQVGTPKIAIAEGC